MTFGVRYYDVTKYEHVKSILAWDKILGPSGIFRKAAFMRRVQSTGPRYYSRNNLLLREISPDGTDFLPPKKHLLDR